MAKKLSAAVALWVAAGYLALSGGAVATERAFVMAAVVLVAVMLDQRAISLRAVALAATILLVWQPEALLGPGFQMSFAATTALVAVYGLIRDAQLPMGPRWLRPVSAVVITSAVAGMATAPLSAAHFNLWSHYGLVANVPSMPVMGLVVMPAAVVGALLMPLGLDALPLWVMGRGLAAILWVAHWVAALDGARGTVPAPGPVVLPMMAFGALVVVLWQGRARLVAVMTDEGRALSKPRGGGFIADNWLENDGEAISQVQAHARWHDDLLLHWGGVVAAGKAAAQSPPDCGEA